MKFLTAQSIASNICVVHMNDESMTGINRVLRAMVPVLRELNATAGLAVVTKQFSLSGLVVNMPEDCLNVFKVGSVIDGKVYLMGADPFIRRGKTTCSCAGTAESSCPACTFHGLSRNYFGEAYASKVPQWQNGTYRWDKDTNRVEFGSGYHVFDGSELLIEYQTSMGQDDFDLIPSEMEILITHKTLASLFAVSNPGVASANMRQFQIHWQQHKRRQSPANPYEIIAALKGNRVSSP